MKFDYQKWKAHLTLENVSLTMAALGGLVLLGLVIVRFATVGAGLPVS